MSNSTPFKNSAGVQMKGAWLANDGCDFVKFVKWCLVPLVLPHGSDVSTVTWDALISGGGVSE